jgi:hypothetical protein
MSEISGITQAQGLGKAERAAVEALLDVYDRTRGRNEELERYYEGDVMVRDVASILPEGARVDARLSCDWARKAVHALASLVRFDGFVFEGGEKDAGLDAALARCNFKAAFSRNRVGMLKKGCMFATVNSVGGRAQIRFHSADSGAAIMDTATERMASGLVIADSRRTEWSPRRAVPTQVNLHLPGARVAIVRDDVSRWHAERVETPPGSPMMVPLVYAPTDTKPLGSSRITGQVRDLVDDVLRVRLALVLSTALYATPMKALLGLSDATYDALSKSPRWGTYLNPMLLATSNKGQVPTLQQLPSNSPAALIELVRADAMLFSGATGVPLNSLGIVQDNPSSAEAIAEARKDLTDEAEALIDEQLTPAMREVALLAMAVESNVPVGELNETQLSVMPRFSNPAMPSLSARTDAAMKIASVDAGFAGTDVFYEMVGLDQATIARLRSEKRREAAHQAMFLYRNQTTTGGAGDAEGDAGRA